MAQSLMQKMYLINGRLYNAQSQACRNYMNDGASSPTEGFYIAKAPGTAAWELAGLALSEFTLKPQMEVFDFQIGGTAEVIVPKSV